ncbi:MAG: sulfotransferase domain-containing protein [Spartobacteria bacterium]
MQVNFVVGGTQKGGTSALDSFLRQHPEICMPDSTKELHHFDREEAFSGKPNHKKYHAHFRPEPQHRAIGEATPIYMYWNAAPYRIWQYNSEMKWILVLRHPAERAYSAWNMETKRGFDHVPFRLAIDEEAARCREALPLQHRIYSYADRGFYAHQVRRLFSIFGEKNCLILLNEELRHDHAKTLERVFNFLGVDPSVVPAKAHVFEQEYEDKIDNELRARLIDMFYFDIKELERLLQRDLSAWYSKK